MDPEHFGALRGLAEVLPERADARLDVLERAAARQSNYLVLVAFGDFYRSQRKDFACAYQAYRHAQEQRPRDGIPTNGCATSAGASAEPTRRRSGSIA